MLILLTSVPLGIWAARHREHLPDFHRAAHIASTCLACRCLTSGSPFLLVLFFSVYLQWLPAFWATAAGSISFYLPVSIAFMSLAINARLLRASMLEVAGQRHVTWARLRGLNATNKSNVVTYSAQRLATDDYRRRNALAN